MSNLAAVTNCSATTCSFNTNSDCTAAAITIGRSADDRAACTTFISLNASGGLGIARSQVGACQITDCGHNNKLMCSAPNISLNSATAECSSFVAA
ncbi:DUF1540 domain-containing protein [Trueperella bialowiezensis]|uniref:Domain of Uncharacterized Function (DUF1540) n=1 Tax=Trueperella bialowiezensis TaxID=312285 RepID=A0A448PGF4_9ACTO|nr:DUF1540 domain-containing protein [Trueperella bialowiezensis]VEI13988.1 Domain of Uncharacterised Function (DUF1540) [Trueperella bialowiezensis]